MRSSFLLAPLFLVACGGDAELSFPDSLAALEAGNRSASAQDWPAAQGAFAWAAEHAEGREAILHSALLGLGEAQLSAGNLVEAEGTFVRAASEGGERHDFRSSQRVVDAWIQATILQSDEGEKGHCLAQAKLALAHTAERFADRIADLKRQEQALASLEAGDAESLAALGYVGD